jgi:hypothetical protein
VAPHNHGRPECAGADQLYTNAAVRTFPRLPSELASLSGTPDDRYSVFFSYSQIYFIAPHRVFKILTFSKIHTLVVMQQFKQPIQNQISPNKHPLQTVCTHLQY